MTQIRRPHYFKGQFLKKDDFIAEQEYHMQMRRLHNSSLHTWGIVDGLDVTADDTGIKISPGSAIDSQGREIWLPLSHDKTAPLDTPLAIPQSTANGGYFVVLTYKEDYDPLSRYPAASETDSDDSKFIRKYETGEPSLIAATPATANETGLLKLALVNITAGKVTGQLDLSVRRNAVSFRGSGGNLEIRPVMRDGSVVVVGDLIINSKNKILLKDGDRNHGVRYSWEEFAGKHLDGPVMYGYGGGALGIKHYNPSREEIALSWDGSGKVAIGTTDFRGKLVVKGGRLEQVPGKFSTRSGAENAGRVFAGADGDLTSVNANDLVEMFDERREVESVAADRKSLTVKGSSFRVYPEGTPLYVMRPDLTTPIFRADDYKGDPKVLITSDGNVGIGTADPQVRLHLKFPDKEKGNAAVLNLEGKDHVYVQWYPLGFDKGRKAWMGYGQADEKHFIIKNEFPDGHLLILSGSGKVGIGVTNPQCELDVMGQVVIRKDGLRFAKEDGGWYPDGWIGMWREKADSARWMHIGGITDDDKERRILLAGSCINLNGKVGIGTQTPKHPLQVGDDQTVGTWRLAVAGRGNIAGQTGAAAARYRVWTLRTGDGTTEDDIHKLRIKDENGGSDRLVIDGSGNVGIGTTSPGGLLEIRNPATEVKVKFGGSGGDVNHLTSSKDLFFNAAGAITFRALNAAYEDLSKYDDLVTISQKGDVKISGRISCGGKIAIKTYHNRYLSARKAEENFEIWQVTSVAGGFEQFTLEMACSRDFKDNISYLTAEEAMTTLHNLNPIKYDYRCGKSFRPNLGFIAEEMPDNLASEDRKSISPFEVIPVLTKVAKEQQKSIARLQATVRALQKQIERHNNASNCRSINSE